MLLKSLLPSVVCSVLFLQSMELYAGPNSSSLRLTSAERQFLELKTCREKFDIGTEKIVARKQSELSAEAFYAEVLCQPHSHYKDSPIHHIVFCDKDRGVWQCLRSEQAIRLIDGKQPLVYFENDIEAATAHAIALILRAGNYYQGEEIPDAQKSVCNITRHVGSDESEMHDVLVATCGDREIFISTWCPQKECPRIIGSRPII